MNNIFQNSIKNFLIAFLFVSMVMSTQALCQQTDYMDIDSYNQLLRAYENQQWQTALDLSDNYLNSFPHSNKRASAIYIAAQSALYLRQFNRSFYEIKRLQLLYPNSEYIDDTHWLLAQLSLKSEQLDSTMKELDWIIAFSTDHRLIQTAQLQQEEINGYLSAFPDTTELTLPNEEMAIGLILPLSGSVNQEFANDFLLGFRISWANYNLGEPLIFDSEGDPIKAVLTFKDAVQKQEVWGFVGGIDPAESAALAAQAQCDSVPFLSTACGIAGLGDIGEYSFQGRIDYVRIGRALASYANESDSTRSIFGILAPFNQEGRQIAQGFKEQIELDNNEVLAEDYYYPGTDEFGEYMKQFRKIGLKRVYSDSLRDYNKEFGHLLIDSMRFDPIDSLYSLYGEVSDSLIDSLWQADHVRLREWIEETGTEIDSLEIPLNIYNGFLVVTEAGRDKIEALGSQFAKFNLQTQLLGNESWMDSEALYRVRNYIDGIVFAQPFKIADSTKFDYFKSMVTGNENGLVSYYHLAGDRAAQILALAAQGARNPNDLRRGISQIQELATLSGTVSFVQSQGVDCSVTLTRYSYGQFDTLLPKVEVDVEPAE